MSILIGLLSLVFFGAGAFLIYILGAVFPGMRILPDHWYGEDESD